MAEKRSNNKTNPFIPELYDIKMKSRIRVAKKGGMVDTVDRETGEIRSGFYQALITEKKYDSEKFIKVYPQGLDVMLKLSKSASITLKYFLSKLGYGDTVALNMKEAMKYTGYENAKTIYSAISELKKENVLANHYRNGIYYINPTMFYRGIRLKLIEME